MKVISTESINPTDIVKELNAQANIADYAACVVFVHAELDLHATVSLLDIGIPHIGSTVLSVYCDGNAIEETITIWLIPAEYKPKVGVLTDVADNNRFVFALSDKDKNLDKLAKQFSFAGGTASDCWTFDRTSLILNGEILTNTTVAVSLEAEYSTLHSSGWQTIPGTESIITEADGACVKRIGQKTAVEFYNTFIPSADAYGAYPIFLPQHGVYRAALNVDLSEGSITFSSDIPQGATVFATTTRRNALIASANQLIAESRHIMPDTSALTILVSCAARNLMLSDVPHFEHKAIFDINKNVLTAYLYSEFVPQADGTTLLQNQHAVISKIRRATK